MTSQQFRNELDKKLCTAADRLRSCLDTIVYKHAVLGLIFLKYVPDSFAQRQAETAAMLKDPKSDFFFDPGDYSSPGKYETAIHAELEERDYYLEQNVFWVPALARWKTVQDSAKLAPETEITVRNWKTTTHKITSTGRLIDVTLDDIEKENLKLKGVLDRHYTQLQIHSDSLVDLIAGILFQHADLHVKDILGSVYEPSGARQTQPKASSQGWREGANQYSARKSIVSLILKMIEPYQACVHDPTMGSGGFFSPVGALHRAARRQARESLGLRAGKWARGVHFGRAKRVRRVGLRRKQPNQSNPTTRRPGIACLVRVNGHMFSNQSENGRGTGG